ncbi:MAG: leucyl aminopeptidase [Actinomycetaceae bacterium]|nr:leucyl aminopeptidase [Actinomycetaceae bacterium]
MTELQHVTCVDETDFVVLGLGGTKEALQKYCDCDVADRTYQDAYGKDVLEMAEALGADVSTESVTIFPKAEPTVVVAGFGQGSRAEIREGVGSALRHLQGVASGATVTVCTGVADADLVQAVAEGAFLGAYQIRKVTNANVDAPIATIKVVAPAEFAAVVERARIATAAVVQARDWGNTPPNTLYPETFAASAEQYLSNSGVKVEILDKAALTEGGFGGILAVGGGSAREPRLVRMSYKPEGAKFHLALVGKGITFDSGGLDIKTGGAMLGMKYDMSGAGAVISAIKAISDLGIKVQATAYASMAENMPSGSSYRVDDVLNMYGGHTVENYNTDAEGRLVMADAIARASEDQPDMIVDVATLTGACMVALGENIAGFMTNDDRATEAVQAAAAATDEEFWHLPITPFIRKKLETKYADFRSGGHNRWGGALVAGAFLEKFVGKDIMWAHLDIAGPANNEGEAYGFTPAGGTGMSVRTLIALAEHFAK